MSHKIWSLYVPESDAERFDAMMAEDGLSRSDAVRRLLNMAANNGGVLRLELSLREQAQLELPLETPKRKNKKG